MGTDDKNRYTISPVEKTMRILETLASEANPVGLGDLSGATRMPRRTLVCSFATLYRMGYVNKDGLRRTRRTSVHESKVSCRPRAYTP